MSTQPLLQRTAQKRIALPIRVEPKVSFANERTFLSWLHFTVVLGGLAVGLLNFGDKVCLYTLIGDRRLLSVASRWEKSALGCFPWLVRGTLSIILFVQPPNLQPSHGGHVVCPVDLPLAGGADSEGFERAV